MNKVNFGCGLSVGESWLNYDASPTLKLQRFPIIAPLAKKFIKPTFPDLAIFGDITRGLPINANSADYVYCSHVLEHLSLEDFKTSLLNVFKILKPGGTFRGVLPDLEQEIKRYTQNDHPESCSSFIRSCYIGRESRPKKLSQYIREMLGNSHHLWMWDYKGLANELEKAGFIEIRSASYGDSEHKVFEDIEDFSRWDGCLGFECRRPAG